MAGQILKCAGFVPLKRRFQSIVVKAPILAGRDVFYHSGDVFMSNNIENVVAAVIKRADNINIVIIAGLTIIILSILVRISKGNEFSIKDISIDLRFLPLIILGITFAHLYTAYVFNSYVRELIYSDIDTSYVFGELRRDGPLFFAGLVARLQVLDGPFGPVFLMDHRDPTTILAHVAAIGAFFAMIRWKGRGWGGRFINLIASGVLVVANWLIGGGWAVHASCLNAPEVCVGLIM